MDRTEGNKQLSTEETKRNETNQNKRKQNKTKQNKTKQKLVVLIRYLGVFKWFGDYDDTTIQIKYINFFRSKSPD